MIYIEKGKARMDRADTNKQYRLNVAAIIVSSQYPRVCEFFVAERSDLKNVWQFPQGGIDVGESPKDALFRELKEEIGTDDIEVLAEYPTWLTYDFPPMVIEKMKPYAGQKQKYFLVKLKPFAEINLQTQEPEFSQYEFMDLASLLQKVTKFKKHIYTQVLYYFKKEGYI